MASDTETAVNDKLTIDRKEYEQLLATRNALAGVMRENERLRKALQIYCDTDNVSDVALVALNANKHTVAVGPTFSDSSPIAVALSTATFGPPTQNPSIKTGDRVLDKDGVLGGKGEVFEVGEILSSKTPE